MSFLPTAQKRDAQSAQSTVEQARRAREERAARRLQEEEDKQRAVAVVPLQSVVRAYLARIRLANARRGELDSLLAPFAEQHSQPPPSSTTAAAGSSNSDPAAGPAAARVAPAPIPPRELYRAVSLLLHSRRPGDASDRRRLVLLGRAILAGMTPPATAKDAYVALTLFKDMLLRWLNQTKALLAVCAETLAALCPCKAHKAEIDVLLRLLITLPDSKTWNLFTADAQSPAMAQHQKAMAALCMNINHCLVHRSDLLKHLRVFLTAGLCRRPMVLGGAQFSAALSLAFRNLTSSKFKPDACLAFALKILAVPNVVGQMRRLCPDMLSLWEREDLGMRCIKAIGTSEQSVRIAFNALEGNAALCLIANLADLVSLDQASWETRETCILVFGDLMGHVRSYVTRKETNISTNHPLLGWFSGRVDRIVLEAMDDVAGQLRNLWSQNILHNLFKDVLEFKEPTVPAKTDTWRRRFRSPKGAAQVDSLVTIRVRNVCSLYNALMQTLAKSRMEVVSALAFCPNLVKHMWRFMGLLGPAGEMDIFLRAASHPETEPLIDILTLACDITIPLLSILSDEEVHDKGDPIPVATILQMATFLNNFVFRSIWDGEAMSSSAPTSKTSGSSAGGLVKSASSLLRLLVDMDCRRSFGNPDLWTIRGLTASAFDSELRKERKSSAAGYHRAEIVLERIPHVIPYMTRVRLFRDEVQFDRTIVTGNADPRQRAWVTIRRGHVLTDGFREISRLPPAALKDDIKIKFVNEQGLDEAGIDERGLFKEFLEETIKAAFDPDFNLFKATTEEKLYPSPTSYVHAEYLQLFEFVGRMLGKAVYDGLVVEVPFAHFFLNTLLGRQNTLSELPSLDADLARNLNFVKTYDGDMEDLDLYFAVDEDVFGQIVTTSLRPGGSAQMVTKENRITYVHLMADFKLNKKLKKEANAFVKGFRSVLAVRWLRYFSAPELQRLISGDNRGLEIEDLKRYVKYYGGYTAGHKVIRWLWEIVGKEFTLEEQGLFLKFVTSCSKPPILGFAALQPPLSIRCVQEDSDEHEYTVGSAIANFFSRGSDIDRLPTSSTCFNLLKLPCYRTKRALREKLRYAINAGAGFEMS